MSYLLAGGGGSALAAYWEEGSNALSLAASFSLEASLATSGDLECLGALSLFASFSLAFMLSLPGSLEGPETALKVLASASWAVLGTLRAVVFWELGWVVVHSAKR